jgi:hypothetical protein
MQIINKPNEMKKFNTIFRKLYTAVFLVVIGMIAFAQEEIEFIPADLDPHDEGYYVTGVWVDENDDGVDEYHNGCDDYWEDEDYIKDGFYDPHVNHEETGEQQDFKYFNCMIMPTCDYKGTAIDPPVETGFIQMSACLYSNTDSAIYSYIQSPQITNLVSIYLETSTNINTESRDIVYNIEYSKDNGTTWEPTFLQDKVKEQGGYRVTYDGSINLEIQQMIDDSKLGSIIIRIITNDRNAAITGEYVRLHSLKLVADKPSSIQSLTSNVTLSFLINDLNIISNDKPLKVYNLMGQIIGTGYFVTVPSSGIYLVKTTDNNVQKVLIK